MFRAGSGIGVSCFIHAPLSNLNQHEDHPQLSNDYPNPKHNNEPDI